MASIKSKIIIEEEIKKGNEKEVEKMKLKELNAYQLLLMSESTLEPADWIMKYSAKFRTIVEDGKRDIEEIKEKLYEIA